MKLVTRIGNDIESHVVRRETEAPGTVTGCRERHGVGDDAGSGVEVEELHQIHICRCLRQPTPIRRCLQKAICPEPCGRGISLVESCSGDDRSPDSIFGDSKGMERIRSERVSQHPVITPVCMANGGEPFG